MHVERLKRSWAGLATASLLLLSSAALAQQPPPATVAACNACHGPGGNSQIPLTPSIAGQPKLFVENQLVLIREGLRDVPQMKEIVAGMSDETIIALAQYFAAQTLVSKSGSSESGEGSPRGRNGKPNVVRHLSFGRLHGTETSPASRGPG